MKRAHLPTMSPVEIRNKRAMIAFYLADECKAKIPDIRAILKCRLPGDVRALKARGERLIQEMKRAKSGSTPSTDHNRANP